MQAIDDDILYRMMNKKTNVNAIMQIFLQMNWLFGDQNCCLDANSASFLICHYEDIEMK